MQTLHATNLLHTDCIPKRDLGPSKRDLGPSKKSFSYFKYYLDATQEAYFYLPEKILDDEISKDEPHSSG